MSTAVNLGLLFYGKGCGFSSQEINPLLLVKPENRNKYVQIQWKNS